MSVYKDAWLNTDCSNDGATNRYTQLWLFGKYETKEAIEAYVKERNIPMDACFQVYDGYRKSVHAKPAFRGGKWYMFGGCFAYTCDARFEKLVGSYNPIAVHDRCED